MVGSKETKRKRKESPPTHSSTPTAAQPAQSSSANIESSPEIPKRTKVQAQRKFAQGQSAPTTSALAAPACSNGPSTSSAASASREPPIEILPNKKPKTEDFLTFLCFRGTNNLPPHLDFLNQSKSRGRPPKQPVTKRLAKAPKGAPAATTSNNKPGKKGRKPAANRKETVAAALATAITKTTAPAKEKTQNETTAATILKAETGLSEKVAAAAAATSPLAPKSGENDENVAVEKNIPLDGNASAAAAAAAESATLPFAVRKRAEQVAKGNRGNGNAARGGRQLRNTKAADDELVKCNKLIQAEATGDKRRSNRTSTKEAKPMIEDDEDDADEDDDDEDEYYSAKDELIKAEEAVSESEVKENCKLESKEPQANAQKQVPQLAKEEAASNKPKEQKKAARSNATKKTAAEAASSPEVVATNGRAKEPAKRAAKNEIPTPKDKPPPVKRPRQKESPIFIPSPEPSGRMTRQRAFFEPVKVPHRDETEEAPPVLQPNVVENSKTKETSVEESPSKPQEQPKPPAAEVTKLEQEKVDLKVFDFSSDDEQPLAKSIKLKANNNSNKKSPPKQAAQARGGRKPAPKKATAEPQKATKNEQATKIHVTGDDADEIEKDLPKEEKVGRAASNKRSKTTKATEPNPATETEHIASADDGKPQEQQQSKAATATGRQGRKRTKASEVNGESESPVVSSSSPTARAQRPSRKTKEAATIYMGIIGHKLQLADDEDDDLSLNSFPDLPNVKEVEKMEIELKKNAVQALSSMVSAPVKTPTYTTSAFVISETVPSPILATKSPVRGSSSHSPVNDFMEKPATARRGRPPKQTKAATSAPVTKREADTTTPAEKKKPTGKKGDASSKTGANAQKDGGVSDKSKLDSDDEDFLLSKEVNVTKRNLAKSFSDSDDEPLAIKVHVKQGEKEIASEAKSAVRQNQLSQATQSAAMPALGNLPTSSTKAAAAPAFGTSFNNQMNASPQQAQIDQQSPTTSTPLAHAAAASPFKPAEKKSPVPTSKILNVPATYSTPPPPGSAAAMNAANYNKAYMPQQLPPVAYHPPHVPIRACGHPHSQMVPIRMPMPTAVPPQMIPIPPPPQSPMKYQPPPTTYPPPIEAYPSPKINPNFLTPKFDRMSIPRANFPSSSPVKIEAPSPSATTSAKSAPATVTTPKTPSTTPAAAPAQASCSNVVVVASSSAAAASAAAAAVAAAAAASADPLKDEIGSILAANLMPSKEESGKIFGIASVSLAQSSGPDNTKCTLGKCGSIHKPVLGPVVPTESYIGDQMSSKERRKAKVNMTHEQIQKWLNECSPNPDEIQDDLDDDYDDNLRPNMNATTPPPTRDDKESTSVSSSSKATRDQGRSESAWSGRGAGPSQRATATATATATVTSTSRTAGDVVTLELQPATTESRPAAAPSSERVDNRPNSTNQVEKKAAEKNNRVAGKESPTVSQKRATKEREVAAILNGGPSTSKAAKNALNEAALQAAATPTAAKTAGKGKKNATAAAPAESKSTVATPPAQSKTDAAGSGSTPSPATATTSGAAKAAKRTPVYNQKAQKQVELKETTTTSHRKTAPFSYGAFSADNEKSVYTFDKDEDDDENERESKTKPAFRRQSRRDSQPKEEEATTSNTQAAATSTTRTSPGKRRAAAAAADKANRDLANANNSSVSLTLSSAENSKQVKVSLEAEKAAAASTAANAAPSKPAANAGKGAKGAAAKKQASGKQATAANRSRSAAAAANKAEGAGGDSDSDGHTFYIPLQGSGIGKDNNGSIQGVAVKLGREGPDGPNQKVIMHATLVTKAQIGADSMNTSSADMVKTLETALATTTTNNDAQPSGSKKTTKAGAATATAAAASTSAAAVSPKNVPAGTAQSRTRANATADATAATGSAPAAAPAAPAAAPAAPAAAPAPSAPAADTNRSNAAGSSLVRVNSNSSLLSGSAKSRIGAGAAGTNAQAAHSGNAPPKKTFKDDTPIKMANNTAFPRHDDPTQMVEAPIFRPTEKEFADPIEFIERITPIAARFGICKIVPPATFKPECRISDDMRFTAYNQYVHKMLHRWGPSAKELSAIKKYLATQSIVMNHPPWIGGMEVDLPRLYHTVQELGGLKEVIEKKKWARVAEEMCIPKLAQDRVTKLDDIYCKYLLPYDTLSPTERQKLFDEVEADWAKREARARRNADRFVNTESVSNEEDDDTTEDDEESEEEVDGVSMECIVKGRSMALNQFYRIARNTMALWFKNTEPIVNEVEAEFWRHVAVRDSHVCVHSGSIDSSGWGYGFPSPGPKGKGSNYARHPWNLKVLTNNPGSVLRSLGPVMGVTVPTLHVGMLFSACCWYRDPHGLSWIEYLHTGASKLWYGIPDDQSANFRAALTSLIPTHCQNKTIWLPCDTVMVPPHMLTDRGVSLCRIEQKPGEFIVVFPRAYTSSLATGYVVSESVYFATTSWLDLAKDDFRDIHESCEPAMFSLEQLLFALGHDQRVLSDALEQMLPMLHDVCEKESAAREQLKAAGVASMEIVHNEKGAKGKKLLAPFRTVESECDLCRANLYISMVRTDEGNVYCLQHAIKNLNSGNIQAKQCKLIHAYQVDDIEKLIKVLNERIQQKRHVGGNRKTK